MRDIRVAAAQFEHRNNDKPYNLSRIDELTRRAVEQGAEIVSFHECSICGYTFLQHLNRADSPRWPSRSRTALRSALSNPSPASMARWSWPA